MSTLKHIHVVGAAIIDAQGRCLIAQRSATMSHPLMWEFPGGKVEPGESPEQALKRELEEELGLSQVEIGEFIARGEDRSESLHITLDVYLARQLAQAPPDHTEHAQVRWVELDQLPSFEYAPADLPAVRALASAGAHKRQGDPERDG